MRRLTFVLVLVVVVGLLAGGLAACGGGGGKDDSGGGDNNGGGEQPISEASFTITVISEQLGFPASKHTVFGLVTVTGDAEQYTVLRGDSDNDMVCTLEVQLPDLPRFLNSDGTGHFQPTVWQDLNRNRRLDDDILTVLEIPLWDWW